MKYCESRAVSQSCRRMTWYSRCTPPSFHFSLFHQVLLCDHWFRIIQSEFKLQLKNFSFLMLLLQCTCRELFSVHSPRYLLGSGKSSITSRQLGAWSAAGGGTHQACGDSWGLLVGAVQRSFTKELTPFLIISCE